jgi:hypothetical protein
MPEPSDFLCAKPNPASRGLPLSGAIGAAWAGLMAAMLIPWVRGATDCGEDLTRNSARLALACWTAAVAGMMQLRARDWQGQTMRGRLTRLFWSLGCLTFLIHVAIAFHFYHHWSHRQAFQHVADSSGFGPGIFISYLFTLVWAADVVWWWASPLGYSLRPAWLDWGLHFFMAFLWFNGSVVYETGLIRWAGLAVAILLSGLLLVRMRKKKCADAI